jgi:hypothetical protein
MLLGYVLASSVFVPAAAEKLSESEAEATLARLSDQEVRDLLIRQFADAAAREEAEEFNPAVILYRLQRDIDHLSTELNGIFAAVDELPSVFHRLGCSLSQTVSKAAWRCLQSPYSFP